MTFLFGKFRGTRILRTGQAGISPAVYSLAGKMPAGPTAKMAVLLFL
jgi:hypothetical protein